MFVSEIREQTRRVQRRTRASIADRPHVVADGTGHQGRTARAPRAGKSIPAPTVPEFGETVSVSGSSPVPAGQTPKW